MKAKKHILSTQFKVTPGTYITSRTLHIYDMNINTHVREVSISLNFDFMQKKLVYFGMFLTSQFQMFLAYSSYFPACL